VLFTVFPQFFVQFPPAARRGAVPSLIDRRRFDTERRGGWSHGANDRSRQSTIESSAGGRDEGAAAVSGDARRRDTTSVASPSYVLQRVTRIDQWQLNQACKRRHSRPTT